jgi:hypothetical protein
MQSSAASTFALGDTSTLTDTSLHTCSLSGSSNLHKVVTYITSNHIFQKKKLNAYVFELELYSEQESVELDAIILLTG